MKFEAGDLLVYKTGSLYLIKNINKHQCYTLVPIPDDYAIEEYHYNSYLYDLSNFKLITSIFREEHV